MSRLQREWERLARSPSAVRRARTWPFAIDRFDSLDDLLAHTGYGRLDQRHDPDDNDALLRLVSIAAGDELAARIVLQRILPGLSSIARKRATTHLDQLDAFDELLTSAWTVIRAYPVERKPRFVAVNLLRDSEYVAFIRPTRRKAVFVPSAPEVLDMRSAPTTEAEARQELAELLDDAERAGMNARDLDVVRRLADGQSTAQIGQELGVSDRTIRNYREAAITRLRSLAAASLAV